MKIQITSQEHPHFDLRGTINGIVPPVAGVTPETVYIVELEGGGRTTVIDSEYEAVELQDA